MKVVVILSALAAAVAASKFHELLLQEWETHKLTHNLNFGNNTEDEFRLDVYLANRIQIAKHNARFARGEVSFSLGINQFTHMQTHEVTSAVNGYNRQGRNGVLRSRDAPRQRFTFDPRNVTEVPDEADWREKGAVTPVKNQGFCGSCYAFSATGSLEGQHFLRNGTMVSLSEQNLLDCSRAEGNNGCDGGLIDLCFTYIKINNGIDTEESYPYKAHEQKKCNYSESGKGATDSGFVDIPEGDEEALMKAVATIGPISVAIDASAHTFSAYHSGVYDEPRCSNTSLDHAVLVVGYGTTNGTDYWIVKNSWGLNWGEEGYLRMSRNKGNQCGIATKASYPLV